jgi:hypothetical protein
MNANEIIMNLINGNLTDAQEASKKLSLKKLVEAGQEYMGYDYNQALITACYLKQEISFEDYCDSLNNKK